MSAPLQQVETWHWADITPTEALERIFPEVQGRGICGDNLIPGRSWAAWAKPPKATELDVKVYKLINEDKKSKFLSKERLADAGIMCPFYAVRSTTLRAVVRARETHQAFSATRRKNLKEEREQWCRRVIAAEAILGQYGAEDGLPAGSIHLNDDDLDPVEIGVAWTARQSRREALRTEVVRDRDMMALLDAEMARLDRLKGEGSPDTWRVPFFIEMANLWTALTGKPVPAASGIFTDLLADATRVVSGGKDAIEQWGQAKTLRPKLKDAGPGKGFRLHEADWFCDECLEHVLERGAAIQELYEIAQQKSKYGELCSAIAIGAIDLRDNPKGALAFIMREAVLRPAMIDHDMLSPDLEAQLGWLNVPMHTEMRASLRSAVAAARGGDQAAAAVLRVAYACGQSVRASIEDLGWTEPAPGVYWNDMVIDHEMRDGREVEGHFRSGDDRAFTIALDLIWISLPSLRASQNKFGDKKQISR